MPDSRELKDNSLDALYCWHLAFYSSFLTCLSEWVMGKEDFIAFELILSNLSLGCLLELYNSTPVPTGSKDSYHSNLELFSGTRYRLTRSLGWEQA